MRTLTLSVLLPLALSATTLAAPAPFATQGRPDRTPHPDQVRERRRVSLAFVRPGMTRSQVIDLIGHPRSEMRGSKFGWFMIYYDLRVTVRLAMDGDVVEEIQRHQPQ